VRPSYMDRSGSAIRSWQAMPGSRRKTWQDSSSEYSKSIVRPERANYGVQATPYSVRSAPAFGRA
jgi:hypothetical protein